jgi:hypothetical protein
MKSAAFQALDFLHLGIQKRRDAKLRPGAGISL